MGEERKERRWIHLLSYNWVRAIDCDHSVIQSPLTVQFIGTPGSRNLLFSLPADSLFDKGLKKVDRYREKSCRVILCSHLTQGLQVP